MPFASEGNSDMYSGAKWLCAGNVTEMEVLGPMGVARRASGSLPTLPVHSRFPWAKMQDNTWRRQLEESYLGWARH